MATGNVMIPTSIPANAPISSIAGATGNMSGMRWPYRCGGRERREGCRRLRPSDGIGTGEFGQLAVASDSAGKGLIRGQFLRRVWRVSGHVAVALKAVKVAVACISLRSAKAFQYVRHVSSCREGAIGGELNTGNGTFLNGSRCTECGERCRTRFKFNVKASVFLNSVTDAEKAGKSLCPPVPLYPRRLMRKALGQNLRQHHQSQSVWSFSA